MELPTNEILMFASTVIVGLVMNIITQLAKMWRIDPRVILVFLCVIAGLAYSSFQTFVPEEMRQSITMFATSSMAFAVTMYEFFWKKRDQ